MGKRKKQLLQQKADLTAEAAAVFAKCEAEERGLTEDEVKRDDEISVELEQVATDLTALERQEARARDLGTTDGVQAVADHSPAQLHDLPTFNSLGEQLQAIARSSQPGAQIDPRLLNVQQMQGPQAATGASEAIPQDGGWLVQRDYTTELLQRAKDAAILAPRCRTIQISGPGLDAPYFDETSRVEGSRFGGVQVFRNHEAESVTAKKPKFGKHKMDLEDLTALAYASDNLLEDATALQGIFALAFESEFSLRIDNEILNGSGAGEMLGILNAPCLVTIAKEGGQAAATIVQKNISKMWTRMYGRSRANAIWINNQDTEPQLDELSVVVGTAGTAVYMPAGGLNDSPNGRLKGRPVIPVEHCETLGTVGDLMLVDLSQYLIIEKGGLQSDTSMHVRFINHEQTFRWKVRNNGQPMWASALIPAKGSNTLSPFVALATRS